jgi:non-heme chloroperoxidase
MNGRTGTYEVEPGVRLFVQDWGEGRPIVLIHGWPLSHRMFDFQTSELPNRGLRVIAPDLRGYGWSTKTWDGLDYDTWARDIDRLMEILDLNDVVLAGFSMGGAIAMHYAAAMNEGRITKLALLAAAGPCFVARPDFPPGIPADLAEKLIGAERADPPKSRTDFGKNFFSSPVDPEMAEFYNLIMSEPPQRSTVRGLEELRDRDLRGELSNIDVPTAIFHGVNDKIVPFQLGEVQRDMIEGSTLIKFEKGGHGFCVEEKDKMNDELERFALGGAERKERALLRAESRC